MGQNYSSVAVAEGHAGLDVPQLVEITYERSIGSARFLKVIRAKDQKGNYVIVKVFAKPTPTYQLDDYRQQIERERDALEHVPNALTHQRVVETDRACYLLRQYISISLYDRISTRPFLETIEKRWIAFQLLYGLRDCHALGVHHGDIKAENVLVTSWNWVYLTDFAPFKPTYLPEDNPADFSYFFDTSGRRTCYVAPERFVAERKDDGEVTDQMDIFSLGCVIAELFLEGTPLFTLSQLFNYRAGEYDPQILLSKIEDSEIRDLIHHMINVDPAQRLSAEKYLARWRRKAFPEYFYSFLHQYISHITDPTAGRADLDDEGLYGRADDTMDRLYHDFDKISYLLDFEQTQEVERSNMNGNIIPVCLDIPNYQRHAPTVKRRAARPDDGSLIFVNLIASFMRNTSRAAGRVRGCDLMLAIAERLTDEAKMDRCLPYLVNLLNDKSSAVQVAAIRSVTQLMELVDMVTPINANIFREYILPKMQHCVQSESTVVRAAYASCLACLASNVSRFLDMTQALRADGVLPTADPDAEIGSGAEMTSQALYDLSRGQLVLYFQEHSKLLLTDENSSVRRAFLRSVSALCVFFGKNKANDVLLSHLNTYLNDNDWMLRCAFFETITGVAAYVGGVALEQYIMPLMVQSLTDPEEFVVEKVLRSLATMAELGLFQRSTLWELVDTIGRFTMHPNIWIRESTVAFISISTKWLSPADMHCIIYPLIKPFLRAQIVDLGVLAILDNLQKPLARPVFDMAVTWATQAKESEYWRGARAQKIFAFGFNSEFALRDAPRDVGNANMKGTEDQQWLRKLRNLGLGVDEGWKLNALREYIWRTAQGRPKLAQLDNDYSVLFQREVKLQQDLRIQPKTIFFEENLALFGDVKAEQPSNKPATIADALLDASKTIDSAQRRHPPSRLQLRRVASDVQKARANGGLSPASRSGTPGVPLPSSEPGSLATQPQAPLAVTTKSPSGESSAPMSPLENGHGLRHRGSMVSLLTKGIENSKAAAETSTVSATAFGRVETPFSRDASALIPITTTLEPEIKFRTSHSYDGNDPHMLKLLDGIYVQNFPSDIVEFGPTIVPYRRRQPIKKSSARIPGVPWKPDGTLVAQFAEHSAAINRIVTAPDHTFFLTASDDGTVKVWDTSRLEKNVAYKSRQTYYHNKSEAVKVKSLCFIENTRCFVSGATDGSIHVVKVDFNPSALRFGKLKPLRNLQLPEQEHAVWMEHFKSDANSILVVATDASNIYGFELRTKEILYTLRNPVHHGTPTCFCIDRKRAWLVLSTTHGILDLWDLRFHVRVRSWGLPGSTPIHRLALHPTNGRWIIAAGGTGHGEMSVWDVQKVQCREVYKTSSSGKDAASTATYDPWLIDESSPEEILSRFASSLDDVTTAGGNLDAGVRALYVGEDFPGAKTAGDSSSPMGFVIAAGADQKVRFWNMVRVPESTIVSGPDVGDDGIKVTYAAEAQSRELVVNTERVQRKKHPKDPSPLPSGGAAAPSPAETGRELTRGEGTAAAATSSSGSGRKKPAPAKTSRNTVISHHQQQLLKSHLDTILDVALLEVPYGMVVSADRSGMVYVYQ